MTTYSLSQLFHNFFHNGFSFDEFLSLDLEKEVTVYSIKNTQIVSPSQKLKKYHEFLNSFIFSKLSVCSDICFSYQKEKSVYDCIYPHKDSKYYLSTDLTNFFNSIKKENIKTLLEKNIQNIKIDNIKEHIEKIVNLASYDGVLPVGFAPSAKISNAFLYDFDLLLKEYCNDYNIVYTRYSDDLIFSCEDYELFDQLIKYIEKLLKELFSGTLSLNLKKTKTQSKKQKIKLLGVQITPDGNLTVDKKIKTNIVVLFYFYINDKARYKDFLNNKFDGRITKVFGTLSYINSIDSYFLDHLRSRYGNYIVDSFLHRSVYE